MADGALITARGCEQTPDAMPKQALGADPTPFVRRDVSGEDTLELLVEGAKCANCIAKIERNLLAIPGVRGARQNLSTKRLSVRWTPGTADAKTVFQTVERLGYGVRVFDAQAAQERTDEEGRRLLRCLAVAAFAAMNIMMFSLPIWFGDDMGDGTRTLLHGVSALIAIPCALYAAQPFFSSAFTALRAGRANMDVPISLAVILTLVMSVAETLAQGAHAYFDGVVMLLLFLLIGRYLDHGLRERARTAARDLLAMQAAAASRIDADGAVSAIAISAIAVGDRILLAAGDRVPVDGVIEQGASDLDCAMLTGETTPIAVKLGDRLQAGAVNLTGRLVMRAQARAQDSALAELARLIEAGEQGRARFVRLADRAARLYVPVVHSLALLTFLGWAFGPALLRVLGLQIADAGLHAALQNAVAVLIITCPCALGLAVPAVQVVATGRLFKAGILVKSGDALERFASTDTIVFDKTGTLTLGRPRLTSEVPPDVLARAASLARISRHPLSRALVAAAGPGAIASDAEEHPGEGVSGTIDGKPARLGRRAFAAPGVTDADDASVELWFTQGDAPPMRLRFVDELRTDAAETVRSLRARGYAVELISGDRASAVAETAREAGIDAWRAGVSPTEKTEHIRRLIAQGRKPLMVGDGLNDAAALAAAHASASPGTAVEASQAAADLVFQGGRLGVLLEAIDVAKAARGRALENLRFSALYNLIAAPAAMAGLLTPMIAAAAMSSSSIVVTLNALRLGRITRKMRGAPWAS